MRDPKTIAAAGAALLCAGAIAAASLRGEPQRRLDFAVEGGRSREVSPQALAGWMIEGRRDFTVVDLREHADWERGHVRGAVSCGTCHASKAEGALAQQGESFVDLSKKLVLYTATDREPVVLPRLFHDNQNLLRLRGGWQAWEREVLDKAPLEGSNDGAEAEASLRHEAIRAFLSGERPALGAPAKLPVAPIRRSGEHKAAGASEGC